MTQLDTPKRKLKFGVLRGKVKIAADFDAIYMSAASIWEIAIKSRLGRLEGDPVYITRTHSIAYCWRKRFWSLFAW